MAETSTTQVLPAVEIEAAAKPYIKQLQDVTGQFKTADLAKVYGPQFVAGLDPLTQQAMGMAGGLGSYAPYLQAAGRLAGTAESTLGGLPTDIATARGTLTGVPSDIAASQAMLAQAQSRLGGVPTDIAGARGELGTAVGDIAAARGMIGPTAYQQYMSPYQQDVIDATLQEYDIQTAKGIPALRAQAISAGAYGGGREGVAQSEFASEAARNRAALQAQLLQQGFGQAQQLAQQAQAQRMGVGAAQAGLAGQRLGIGQAQLGAQLGLSGQQAALAGQRGTLGQLRGQLAGQQLGVGQAQLGAQMGLAGQQLGIGQFQAGLAGQAPGLVGQQISGLTTLGGLGQAQRQAQLAAQQQLAQQQLTQGLTATQALGSGLTSLIAGYPGQSTVTTTPTPSPLQTALSTGATLAGLYKGFGNIFS
jgi:hypothetical protein